MLAEKQLEQQAKEENCCRGRAAEPRIYRIRRRMRRTQGEVDLAKPTNSLALVAVFVSGANRTSVCDSTVKKGKNRCETFSCIKRYEKLQRLNLSPCASPSPLHRRRVNIIQKKSQKNTRSGQMHCIIAALDQHYSQFLIFFHDIELFPSMAPRA